MQGVSQDDALMLSRVGWQEQEREGGVPHGVNTRLHRRDGSQGYVEHNRVRGEQRRAVRGVDSRVRHDPQPALDNHWTP